MPPILPGYLVGTFGTTWLLNSIFHLSSVGIASTATIGSLAGYFLNTNLAPYFLRYYRWAGYFTDKDWKG